jgi:uncharacterized protein YndB with AHSA1/START domain
MLTQEDLMIRRTFPAPPELVWDLWTTPKGISAWWAPDGFKTTVTRLDLRPGGNLDYKLTATGPRQIAFLKQSGMPLSKVSHKVFVEVDRPTRLSYTSLIDFVPGQEPYVHLTAVSFDPTATGTEVVMRLGTMHDRGWTDRIVTGRSNELDNLAKLLVRMLPA